MANIKNWIPRIWRKWAGFNFFLKDVKIRSFRALRYVLVNIIIKSSTDLSLVDRNWLPYVRGRHYRIQEWSAYWIGSFIVGSPLDWDWKYGPQVIVKRKAGSSTICWTGMNHHLSYTGQVSTFNIPDLLRPRRHWIERREGSYLCDKSALEASNSRRLLSASRIRRCNSKFGGDQNSNATQRKQTPRARGFGQSRSKTQSTLHTDPHSKLRSTLHSDPQPKPRSIRRPTPLSTLH